MRLVSVCLCVCLYCSPQGAANEEEVAQRQCKLFSTIPEFGVKDMVIWFLFILNKTKNCKTNSLS